MTTEYDSSGLAKLTPDALVLQSPCADCGCGSLCHWDDLATPGQGQTAADWAIDAHALALIECQRCPCKSYRIVNSKPSASCCYPHTPGLSCCCGCHVSSQGGK